MEHVCTYCSLSSSSGCPCSLPRYINVPDGSLILNPELDLTNAKALLPDAYTVFQVERFRLRVVELMDLNKAVREQVKKDKGQIQDYKKSIRQMKKSLLEAERNRK